MATNDLISDFLTRIRNAILADQKTVQVLNSKMIRAILEILKTKGYILDFVVDGIFVQVDLAFEGNRSKIKELKRVSKPGIRKYVKYRDIKPAYNGLGVSIYSTPKGVITGEEAVKQKVGGEYLCYVF